MAGERWLPSTLALASCLCALATAHPASAAPTLTPVLPTVAAGSSVTLTLNDTIAPGSGVGAVDLQISFNPALLAFQSVADGTLLTNAGWDPPQFNPSNGLVSISEDLGNDAQGTGSVVTLTFTALASDGTTATTISAQTTPGSVGVSGEYQLPLTTDTIDIAAAISVPEPGTALLLLVPVLAAARASRRGR